MLSDDAEQFDRSTMATNRTVGRDLELSPHHADSEHAYSPWGILSLDVRGAFGRAGDDEDEPDDHPGIDLAALYTIFGGTSAACAMLAGLTSLLLQAGELTQVPISRADLRRAIGQHYKGV